MPELPEITVYVEALERFVAGEPLERVRVRSPSLVRSYDPPLSAAHGRTVTGVRRMGKRVVLCMEEAEPAHFLVLHLMVTGRLRWRAPGVTIPRKLGLAAFDFPEGSLLLTEAGMKKKATLHLVAGEEALAAHDRGGVEPLDADLAAFREAIARENRTLKRALTDPRILSGIGNAHSDEILLEARLSPLKRSRDLSEEEAERLFEATRSSLRAWTDTLRAEVGDAFPEKITAFHPDMAAHGKYGEPCPRCGSPIQRIKYADNETNYCATCQTGGRLLADRAFSRLLREDWPRSLEELEGLLGG
ncbi:MAG TPA: DNA-formamidopyrimidine glycosylase family protein [Longimicrobiales bacterium]|nr:DNA-formamidopyrimidine glycosylase family protein [Longimicrobiales bacterium]